MSSWVWIGFLAFFVVALVVGVRLLWLWTRTRELPELLIGIGVLGIGPVGFGCQVAGGLLGEARPDLASLLFGVAFVTVATGVTCKCLFNVRVYHPASQSLTGLVVAAALFYACLFALRLAGSGFGPESRISPLGIAQSWVQIGALLWGAGEALRYWVLMRRRARLGLADPVVTNRFLMWGVGAGAAGVGSAVGNLAQMITGASSLETPWLMASSSAHGLVSALALWLAFVPPAAYVRMLRRRARTAEA